MRGSSMFRLALLLAAAGCAPSATQLIVSVDTDLPVRSGLDRVVLSVARDGTTHEQSAVLDDRGGLPLTLAVIPICP